MKSRLLIVFLFGLSISFWTIADTDVNTDDKAVKTEEPKGDDEAKSADAEKPVAKEVEAEEADEADEAEADEVPAAAAKTEKAKTVEPAVEVIVEEVVVEKVPVAPAKTEEVKKEEPAATKKAEEAKVEKPADKPSVETPAAAPVAAPVVAVPAPVAAPAVVEAECETCPCLKIGKAILLYIPNRILDFNDSFTMDIGVGSEAGAELDLTKYFQIGGIYGSKYYLTKGYNNQYGGGYSEGWSYSFAPPTSDECRFLDESFGSVKEFIVRKEGLHIPAKNGEDYENKIRDFWSIGVSGGWLVTVNFEMHPVDFADFVTGLFFYDFKGNDLK